MFDNLVESRRERRRSIGQASVSVVVHGVLLVGAVRATRGAEEPVLGMVVDTIVLPPLAAPERPTVEAVPGARVIPGPKAATVEIPIPADLPALLPAVASGPRAFDPSSLVAPALAHGIGTRDRGGLDPIVTSAEADDPPQLVRVGRMRAPPGMEGVAARVVLEFVVDTQGQVEPGSIRVASSSSALFEASARAIVQESVFRAGRRGGRPVRVQVRQAVRFD